MLLIVFLGTGCATTASRQKEEVNRKRARSHFNQGVDHLESGRTARGLRALLTAQALAPKTPYTPYALGRAYLAVERDSEAEQHLIRALEIHPELHDARLTLSGVYLILERWVDAAREARILIDDPTFSAPWQALTNIGWADYKRGNLSLARENLELALEFNPTYWQSHLNLGILETREGHQIEALRAFGQVLDQRVAPTASAEANYRIAEIYVSLGKRDRALYHLNAAVTESADSQWGQKSEEYLKLLR